MSHKPAADAIVDGTIVGADISAAIIDPVAGTAGLRTLGTGAQQAAQGSATELLTNKGAVSGYCGLDAGSKVATANLGSGTANSTTFLRGDQSYATPTATVTVTVATKSTAYTSTTSDDVLLCDAAGGAFSVTLHAASTWTKTLTIKRVNSGANAVTVDPNASETIDGAATRALSQQYESVTLCSNGSNIFVL
jgi:hypothetical protein